MYWVYLLECADGSLYCGITTDVARRLAEHRAGLASKYTRARGAVRMVYTQQMKTRSAALVREAALKRLSRTDKLKLTKRTKASL